MKRAVLALRDILRRQSNADLLWNLDQKPADVQAKICLELGRRRAKDAVGKLRSRLGSANEALREAAAEALGEIGDINAVPTIAEMLNDYDSEVRMQALHTLGQLQDKRQAAYRQLSQQLRAEYEAAAKRAQKGGQSRGAENPTDQTKQLEGIRWN